MLEVVSMPIPPLLKLLSPMLRGEQHEAGVARLLHLEGACTHKPPVGACRPRAAAATLKDGRHESTRMAATYSNSVSCPTPSLPAAAQCLQLRHCQLHSPLTCACRMTSLAQTHVSLLRHSVHSCGTANTLIPCLRLQDNIIGPKLRLPAASAVSTAVGTASTLTPACLCLQDKVGSRTMEGRRLRQHVLRGAVIVFITAGYSGKRFIFEKVGRRLVPCLLQ